MAILEIQSMRALPDGEALSAAVSTYQESFAQAPYYESFTDKEVVESLDYIVTKGGDLVFGWDKDELVALAGGYITPENDYYVEELAVRPDKQSNGFGRATLRALLEIGAQKDPDSFELRTILNNIKALELYQSEGFKLSDTTEIVPQRRVNATIGLDERIYLRKQLKEVAMNEQQTFKRIAIAYPSGNTTAIVFDRLLNTNRRSLNSRLMEVWKKQFPSESEIEQCCFVTFPKDQRAVARVEMFGGEFCGNATRSVIQLVTAGEDFSGFIEVSGVDRPLRFRVLAGAISLEMPLPQESKAVQEVTEGRLVQLDGITQLVVTAESMRANQSPREVLTNLIEQNRYGLADLPAVGVTFYDKISGKSEFCVWVRDVGTIFDETACGSGTCAIGVALACEKKDDVELEVIQPSGDCIVTKASYDISAESVKDSEISGEVKILYDGKFPKR